MAVVVELPGALRPLAGGQSRISLPGRPRTLRDALSALAAAAPGVADRITDEQGCVRRHVNVFVGTENVRDLQGLDTPLAEDAEVFVLPNVSGGLQDPSIARPA
jgi:molybdopterin converting factor small subunit